MRYEAWVQPVTPEDAKEWLSRPVSRQRKITRSQVELLSKQLQSGKMQSSPQAFLFEKELGGLLDGQHRATAIVETGIGLEQAVLVAGVPAAMFGNIDQSLRRSAGQFTQAANAATVASAARFVLAYREDPTMIDLHRRKRDIPIDLVVKEGEGNEAISALATRARAAAKGSRVPASILTAVGAIAYEKHADLLDEWFEGLASGAGLERGDARLALRNAFLDRRARGDREQWGLVVKAWNAYVNSQNRTLARFRVGRGARDGEAMPEIL